MVEIQPLRSSGRSRCLAVPGCSELRGGAGRGQGRGRSCRKLPKVTLPVAKRRVNTEAGWPRLPVAYTLPGPQAGRAGGWRRAAGGYRPEAVLNE